jgi:hypothetical protein
MAPEDSGVQDLLLQDLYAAFTSGQVDQGFYDARAADTYVEIDDLCNKEKEKFKPQGPVAPPG